jgi:hypothetical protein
VRRWLPRRWRTHRRTHARAPSGGAGGLSLCRIFLLPLVKRMNTMVRTLYRGHPLYDGHPGIPGSGLLCRLLTSTDSRLSAGGPLTLSAHPARRGERRSFWCRTYRELRVASVLRGVFGTIRESLYPQGLVVRASQPAKRLTIQEESWSLRGMPRKKDLTPLRLNGCSRPNGAAPARVANRCGLLPPLQSLATRRRRMRVTPTGNP